MVSVCMAVRNGARYVREQVDSILCQLGPADELVVSDDHSSDETIALIKAFDDPRISIYINERRGIVNNFEWALTHAKGDFIFLADQDDIWYPDKVEVMCRELETCDAVVCDCALVKYEGEGIEQRVVLAQSFFLYNRSRRGLLRNLMRNSYMGCCMAFRRSVLQASLPFPARVGLHDSWIGVVAEARFRTKFIDRVLLDHRIHSANASTTGRKSSLHPFTKIHQRYQMVRTLLVRNL